MASLNLPIPGAVKRLANELHPKLTAFGSVRDRHTLVAKRLTGDEWERNPDRVRTRLRQVLDRTEPFSLRIASVDYFEQPAAGAAPVVYLAVESPALHHLHGRLCREYPPVTGIEGDDYTPHVTLARGGSFADAERLAEEQFEPIEWTVSEAVIWDGQFREAVDRFDLRG